MPNPEPKVTVAEGLLCLLFCVFCLFVVLYTIHCLAIPYPFPYEIHQK